MRRICLILVLLLAMPTFAVAEHYLTTIYCDNQGFSTMCLDDQSWEQLDDGGLIIWVDQPDSDPYVSIRWDKEADKSDPRGYFDNVFTPLMEETFGDKLMDPSDYSVYEVEGVSMPGVQYAWEGDDGRVYITFRLLDTRWEGLVTFTAMYYYEERDGEPMNVLSRAVFGFQPGRAADAPAPTPKTAPRTQALGGYQVSAARSIVPGTEPYSSAGNRKRRPHQKKRSHAHDYQAQRIPQLQKVHHGSGRPRAGRSRGAACMRASPSVAMIPRTLNAACS